MIYLSLFFSAFIAATLIPAFSELVLTGLILEGHSAFLLWFVATLGNVLGACVNWGLGAYLFHLRDRKWFPASKSQLDRAQAWFKHWGIYSLLFAWLPVVGDPLTLVAGLLRVRFWVFLVLVGIGKGARYGVLVWLALGVV